MRCSSRLSSAIAPRRAEVELGVLRDAPAATSEKRGTFVGGMDRYRAVMAEVVSDAGWQAGDAADGGAVSFPSAVGIASADLFCASRSNRAKTQDCSRSFRGGTRVNGRSRV